MAAEAVCYPAARWFYEVGEMTRLMLADDYDGIHSRLDATLDTVSVIESARKAAW